jgi:hypothetical protein
MEHVKNENVVKSELEVEEEKLSRLNFQVINLWWDKKMVKTQ